MNHLNHDVLCIIFSFLNPENIISVSRSCPTFEFMMKELFAYKGFVVYCKVIMKKEQVRWFQQHKITFFFMSHYKKEYQCKQWFRNGQLHRDDDLPAKMYDNGDKEWYRYGLLHRDHDLPAVITSSGDQKWYRYGKLHRENDLPAVITFSGDLQWFRNGRLHRDDNNLPTWVCANGSQYWFRNGRFVGGNILEN